MAGIIGNTFLKNAVAAYSIRRINSKYKGAAIRVRRDSDNSEQDIGFTESGELDTSSILSFAPGASNVYVTMWYDQSGNGMDQSRTIADQQPQIVSNGTIYMVNGKPALYFNGNMSMRSVKNARLASMSGEWSSFGVVQPTGGFDIARVYLSYDGVTGGPASERIGQFIRAGSPANPTFQSIAFRIETPISINDSGLINNTNQNILNSIRTKTTVEIFVNNQTNGPTSIIGTPTTGVSPLDIGYRGGASFDTFQPVGYIQELIHYNVDTNNYYKSILDRINSYYKVY